MAQRMGKEEVIAFLCDGGYEFKMVEHEAVFTMEGMEALNLSFGEEVVKNLFMPEDKPANLKELRTKLEARPLRFASEEDLVQYLGLRGGAVSPFGVLNDEEALVQVVFDEELRTYKGLGVHPNDNTATLHVALGDMVRIVEEHGNAFRFVELSRPEPEE